MKMASRGRGRTDAIIKLALDDSPTYESPADDSDIDPDYNPVLEKRKSMVYFKNSDIIFPGQDEFKSGPDPEPMFKRRKVINYTDATQPFPSPSTWEFQGLSESTMTIAIAKVNSDLIAQQAESNVAEDRSYFQLQPMNNIEILDPPSTSKTSSCADMQKNSTDGLMLSSLNEVPHNDVHNDEADRGEPELSDATLKSPSTTTTEKLSLLPSCQNTCRKKCSSDLNSDQRKAICDYFKNLNFGQKQLFLDKYIIKQPVKYRKVDAEKNKQFSIAYNLPVIVAQSSETSRGQIETTANESPTDSTIAGSQSTKANGIKHSNMISVCKTMFLHTIGSKSDGIITNFLKRTVNDLPCLQDKRGRANAIKMKEIAGENYKSVKNHIESYHPLVSHYNLEHAPTRRYLPCDISIHEMRKGYVCKNKQLSYVTYRKIFERENIGFSSPTQDDCGACSIFKEHTHPEEAIAQNASNNASAAIENNVCLTCQSYDIHKQRYTIARQKYNEDTEKKWDDDHDLYTVDMQKVLILPKMTIKNSFFVSRLVVFHETFANLKAGGENKCILWHEAIRGRNGPDVVSAYYNMLIRLSDETKHVTLWADNCTAQIKNWVLFTACTIFVNQNWGPETITLKFFEPGHSFMKADSIHGQIGKKWKKTPKILDYEDLEKLIRSSNKSNNVISLRAEDFKRFENGCMQRKKGFLIPKLADIKSVQFRKGYKKLFFKLQLGQDEFEEADYLKPKFKLELPHSEETERGINSLKKDTIVKELLPHMEARKQLFWKNLRSFDGLDDLGKSVGQLEV